MQDSAFESLEHRFLKHEKIRNTSSIECDFCNHLGQVFISKRSMKIEYFDIEEFPRKMQKFCVSGIFAVVSASILWQLMVAVQ